MLQRQEELYFHILFVAEPLRALSSKTLHPDQCSHGKSDGGVNPTQSITMRQGNQESVASVGAFVGWVALKELKLSYYIGETLLFPIYTHNRNPKP